MPERSPPLAGRLSPDLWHIAAAMCVAVIVLLVVALQHELTIAPKAALASAILLALLALAALLLSGVRAGRRVEAEALAGVVRDLSRAIQALGRLPGSRPASAEPDGTAPPSALAARCLESGLTAPAPRSGYVLSIRREALIAAAAREGAVIRLAFRPGQFVATGATLAHVWPAERLNALAPTIRGAITIGWNRELTQDPELGIAELVKIALRSLSPAVNDSFTAIACIDWLSESVATFARIPEPDGAWRDGGGKIRVLEPVLRFERVAKAAFEQIRQNAGGNIAVTIRLLQAFERLGPLLTSDAQRTAIRAQAEAIREAVARGGLARGDTADVVSAHSRAKAALEPKQAA